MGFFDVLEYMKENILLLDGAMGTELQKRGMPQGVCPEVWALQNPGCLAGLQREYVEAGSKAVYTFTLGASRLKLKDYGFSGSAYELNRKHAEITRKAVGENILVAGDVGPLGKLLSPLGEVSFEEAVDVFAEQMRGLADGGVDFIAIETMLDIREARAALIAAKENLNLPVLVSMTFNEDGLTLTGTDPVTALITLQSMGADMVGCNCSTGPKEIINIISEMKPYAKVPLVAKPNAGLPKLISGKTVFDMGEREFSGYVKGLVKAGANAIGGCCGTNPVFIQSIAAELKGLKPAKFEYNDSNALTSATKTVFTCPSLPVRVIGERINPTGKKNLQNALKNMDMAEVKRIAVEQVEKGAGILDVNVGMPGIDERETMVKVVETLSQTIDVPLCIDSAKPDVIEAALRVYPGRALINSITGEKKKMEKLLPIAAKYGSAFIALPLADEGVPEKVEDRKKIVLEIIEEARKYGFTKKDIIVDGLVMTVSSNQRAAAQTLELIEWSSRQLGCATVIGLSNISFGLPERSFLNAAFLSMAAARGLSMAILNPVSDIIMNIKMACDVLTGKDSGSAYYIGRLSQRPEAVSPDRKEQRAAEDLRQQIFKAVLKGDTVGITALLDKALKENEKPSLLVDEVLIPAITKVGELYEKKQYFLPQLIRSAQAMEKAFAYLEPMLQAEKSGNGNGVKATVVLATVKGDVHDIGKNIVSLMLKNYGFKVYDLGKDVPAEDIVRKACETKAGIIGLSALMTTTMPEMENVIKLARSKGLKVKFMVGGAAVSGQYAREIGADGYAEDAYGAVKIALRLSEA